MFSTRISWAKKVTAGSHLDITLIKHQSHKMKTLRFLRLTALSSLCICSDFNLFGFHNYMKLIQLKNRAMGSMGTKHEVDQTGNILEIVTVKC